MSAPPPMPGNPPEPEQQSTPGTDRLTRRLVRSTACAAVGAVCLAWTALSAWGLLGTDLGQGHSRLLRLLAPLTLLMTLLLVRRRRENDARLFHLGVTIIMAGATTWCAVHQVSVCLTHALPCRRQATTATASALGMLAVLASMVTGPRTTWFVPVGSRQRTQRAIAGGGAVGVALLLVSELAGMVTDRLTIDATRAPDGILASASSRTLPTSVHGTAWGVPADDLAWDEIQPTVLGPAVLDSLGVRLIDGLTGHELWHYHHHTDLADGLRQQLLAAPDGRHLALVERHPSGADEVTTATIFQADGRVVATMGNAGRYGTAGANSDPALATVTLLDGYWVQTDRTGVTARAWSGHRLWHQDVPDGCPMAMPVTHGTFLLSQGCHEASHVQQMDISGNIVWQEELSEGNNIQDSRHAPDWSATAFVDRDHAVQNIPTLILDEHGKRANATCRNRHCYPGANLTLWTNETGHEADRVAKVYDANNRLLRTTHLSLDCQQYPTVTGAAVFCDPSVVAKGDALGSSVQLPGSRTFTFPNRPQVMQLLPAGGSWIVLACDNSPQPSCEMLGLR